MTDKEIAPWETPEPVAELTAIPELQATDEPTPEQWSRAYRDVVLNMHADHKTLQ